MKSSREQCRVHICGPHLTLNLHRKLFLSKLHDVSQLLLPSFQHMKVEGQLYWSAGVGWDVCQFYWYKRSWVRCVSILLIQEELGGWWVSSTDTRGVGWMGGLLYWYKMSWVRCVSILLIQEELGEMCVNSTDTRGVGWDVCQFYWYKRSWVDGGSPLLIQEELGGWWVSSTDTRGVGWMVGLLYNYRGSRIYLSILSTRL